MRVPVALGNLEPGNRPPQTGQSAGEARGMGKRVRGIAAHLVRPDRKIIKRTVLGLVGRDLVLLHRAAANLTLQEGDLRVGVRLAVICQIRQRHGSSAGTPRVSNRRCTVLS